MYDPLPSDEAHRGAKDKKDKATTIMQKFIKGSKSDGLSPFPVVIGMSATIENFNTLVKNSSSTIRPINITPADVRKSGLLKDEVIILYPEDVTARVDMAVLQAAADDWKKKCEHWEIFYDKQKTKKVNPIFLIQVENGTANRISNTNLNEVIKTVEEKLGYVFNDDEIVHAFGEKTTLTINGRVVRYEEPSRIEENKNIKIVLFKDALSTGWDCPRAETMMSFRRAVDATYIAQLLGRMLRTPLQQHVITDEYLNSVCTTNAYLAILQKCHFEGKTNKRTTFCQQGNNKDSTRKQHQSNTEPTSNQQKNNIELTPKQHWKIQ